MCVYKIIITRKKIVSAGRGFTLIVVGIMYRIRLLLHMQYLRLLFYNNIQVTIDIGSCTKCIYVFLCASFIYCLYFM